jgi:hypothetical protein
MQVVVPVQDTADRPQVGFVPDGVGVSCCCQLAEAGCAITRTADTTSAAVIANRFIAIVTPQEFRWSVPWARCHARYAWQGSPARTPQHGAMDRCARPERGRSGDRKHRMRKVPLPSPCSNTYLSSRSDRKQRATTADKETVNRRSLWFGGGTTVKLGNGAGREEAQMSGEPDEALEVLRGIWSAQEQTSADLDDIGTGKSCKRMADVGFGEVDGAEDDLRAAWRGRLEREGKLSNGGTVADLVLGPAKQG